jgi:hypothetical protein
MGFLDRLRQPERTATAPTGGGSLARDARAMRSALTALTAEREQLDPGRAEVDLRGLVSDLLEGEVAPPTADVALLVSQGVDPDSFYDKELARSWEGLDENHRAARVEQFVGLALMLENADDDAKVPDHDRMLAGVRTKTLLLAFAVDETYGLMRQIERDPESLA